MEKTSVKQKRKFFCGLLIFLFYIFNADAKGVSPSVIKKLTVKPDSTLFFTAQENGYTLKIPGADPYMVQTDLPQLPQGVVFVSSKREEYLDPDGTGGTAVHLWFTFKDTGPVKMPPLIVMVENRTYYLSFEDVTVYENPALINPETVVEFESEVTKIKTSDGRTVIKVREGEEIIFSVGLKYFVQIISFDWQIPKNSIFTDLERFDTEVNAQVNQAAGREFSNEVKKLARFSWKPLAQGDYQMPEVTVTATSYNGSRKTVRLPGYIVRVEKRSGSLFSQKGQKNRSDSVFSSAFSKPSSVSNEVKSLKISKEDCIKLAELRSRERNTFYGSSARKNRIEFEKSLGFSEGSKEARKPAVALEFVFMGIFVIAFIVFIVLGRVKLSLTFLTLAVVAAIFSFRGAFKLRTSYGIFSGGVISPVPENISSSFLNVDGGIRVKITEKTGDYFYIESEDVNGWVEKSLVIEIE